MRQENSREWDGVGKDRGREIDSVRKTANATNAAFGACVVSIIIRQVLLATIIMEVHTTSITSCYATDRYYELLCDFVPHL